MACDRELELSDLDPLRGRAHRRAGRRLREGGHRPAALRDRPRAAACRSRRRRWGCWRPAGWRRRSSRRCSRTRPRRTSRRGSGDARRAGMTGSSRSAAARRSTRQGHRLHARPDPADVGFRGHRRLVDAGRPGRDRPGGRGADHGRDRLGGRARGGHHQPRDPHEEGDLPSQDDAGAGYSRPGADGGAAAVLTAGTGMDAFAHCLEAYASPAYHPMAEGIAVEGLRLCKDYLPRPTATAPISRPAPTCWRRRRWGLRRSRRASAPSTRCRTRSGALQHPSRADQRGLHALCA